MAPMLLLILSRKLGLKLPEGSLTLPNNHAHAHLYGFYVSCHYWTISPPKRCKQFCTYIICIYLRKGIGDALGIDEPKNEKSL